MGAVKTKDEFVISSMVDVGDKSETVREAIAHGTITMKRETLDLILKGDMKKAEHCLKDAYLLHKWNKIQQNNNVDLCNTL